MQQALKGKKKEKLQRGKENKGKELPLSRDPHAPVHTYVPPPNSRCAFAIFLPPDMHQWNRARLFLKTSLCTSKERCKKAREFFIQ